jgi:hypothetical protein
VRSVVFGKAATARRSGRCGELNTFSMIHESCSTTLSSRLILQESEWHAFF